MTHKTYSPKTKSDPRARCVAVSPLPPLSYIVREATPSADYEFKEAEVLSCGAGEFYTPHTRYADGKCTPCVLGVSFVDEPAHQLPTCKRVSMCDPRVQWIEAEPTLIADRSCRYLTTCTANEYEVRPPTLYSDRRQPSVVDAVPGSRWSHTHMHGRCPSHASIRLAAAALRA